MKVFSKHFIIFLALLTTITLLFRIGLSHFLTEFQPTWITVIPIGYGIICFFSGFFLGMADGQKNSFYDIGLRWNLGTMIIWTAVSLAWFLWGNPAEIEHIAQISYPLIIWSVIVIVHVGFFLWVRRKTIKGIHKSEIFE